jgi:hypothetical protein
MHCPALASVPSSRMGSFDEWELTIKATQSGILFLGHYDHDHNKYITERAYRKRYTGSKTCEVSINGDLFTSRADYNKVVNAKKLAEQRKQKEKGRGRAKKKQGCPPASKLSYCAFLDGDLAAISEKNPDCENTGDKKPPKERKKSYTINGPEVRRRIWGMRNTQKGRKRLHLITVSFPAKTPDHICHQALNTWLTSLRKYNMLHDYLWIKERQTGKRLKDPSKATGTLHFHIAVPHYLNITKANNMMRGTLTRFAERGEIPYSPHAPQIYRYNGVDICKNKKTGRVVNFAIKKGEAALSRYLAKYLSKAEGEDGEEVETYEQLAWHNSRGFSALFTGVTFTIDEFNRAGHGHFLNRVRVFKMRYAMFIPWLMGPPPKLVDHLYELNSYIQTVLDAQHIAKRSAGSKPAVKKTTIVA